MPSYDSFYEVLTGMDPDPFVALLPDRATQPGPHGWMGKTGASSRRLALRYGAGAFACTLLALPAVFHGAWLWFG